MELTTNPIKLRNEKQIKNVYRGMNLVGHGIKSCEDPLTR